MLFSFAAHISIQPDLLTQRAAPTVAEEAEIADEGAWQGQVRQIKTRRRVGVSRAAEPDLFAQRFVEILMCGSAGNREPRWCFLAAAK